MNAKTIDFIKAAECTDLQEFMYMVFPEEWYPIVARIIETGAEFSQINDFTPRWTGIPLTVRKGDSSVETAMKTVIFRVHDCLHQLWGIPVPINFDEETRSRTKCMWMCSEIAVLTLNEFFYCQWLYDTQPAIRDLLEKRNTLLFKRTSDLCYKSMTQTAARIDELIHGIAASYLAAKTKQEKIAVLPTWVKDNPYGVEFCRDYIPMLEMDRKNINHNWNLLKSMSPQELERLRKLPNQRYSNKLNGLELTIGMIQDFEHLLTFSGTEIDTELAHFNKQRRKDSIMPETWNDPPK
jgi:hypothetical protein